MGISVVHYWDSSLTLDTDCFNFCHAYFLRVKNYRNDGVLKVMFYYLQVVVENDAVALRVALAGEDVAFGDLAVCEGLAVIHFDLAGDELGAACAAGSYHTWVGRVISGIEGCMEYGFLFGHFKLSFLAIVYDLDFCFTCEWHIRYSSSSDIGSFFIFISLGSEVFDMCSFFRFLIKNI